MIRKTHYITTEPVLLVINHCPLGVYRIKYVTSKKHEFDDCVTCPYYLGKGECGYDLYETELVKRDVDTEEDDGCGGLPSTGYMWTFKCPECGDLVHFTSGFSVISSGDDAICFDCKTKLRFISNKKDVYTFALKINPGGV